MQLIEGLAMFGYHKNDKGGIYIKTTEKFGREHKTTDGCRWQSPSSRNRFS